MKVKFELTCDKVKGLSFHPIRSWVLMSTYEGQIQLWDWRNKALIA
jgi:coatomer subunit alpha